MSDITPAELDICAHRGCTEPAVLDCYLPDDLDTPYERLCLEHAHGSFCLAFALRAGSSGLVSRHSTSTCAVSAITATVT